MLVYDPWGTVLRLSSGSKNKQAASLLVEVIYSVELAINFYQKNSYTSQIEDISLCLHCCVSVISFRISMQYVML
jgi:hypothetical protein